MLLDLFSPKQSPQALLGPVNQRTAFIGACGADALGEELHAAIVSAGVKPMLQVIQEEPNRGYYLCASCPNGFGIAQIALLNLE